jgi:hypothetical protein
MIVRPLHRFEFLGDVELLAGLEHQHLHPLRGQDVRGHAAGGAGSNHDGIIGSFQIDFRLRVSLDQSEQIHAERP